MPFRSDGKRSPDFPYPREKKTPEVFPPSGVNPLDYSTHSPSSRRAPVRSRGSDSFGSACRSGSDAPGNKKGGRECRQKQGDERGENAGGTSGTTLFRQSVVSWVPVTNCQKKGAVPPAPSSTHRPLTEGNISRVTEEILTGRRHYDQTTT